MCTQFVCEIHSQTKIMYARCMVTLCAHQTCWFYLCILHSLPVYAVQINRSVRDRDILRTLAAEVTPVAA